MEPTSFRERDLDALREVANIGAGHAAGALSRLVRRVITIEVPRARALGLSEVPAAVGGAEALVVGVHLRVHGAMRANLLLTFPPEGAGLLLRQMGTACDDLLRVPPPAASALREVGNILGGTYLNAVSQLLHVALIPSVPGLAIDMAGAVVDLLLTEIAGASDEALVLETTLREPGGGISGSCFLLPDPAALGLLVGALRSTP